MNLNIIKRHRNSIILTLRVLIVFAYAHALADTIGRYEGYWASLFDLTLAWSFEFNFENYRTNNVIAIVIFLIGVVYSAVRVNNTRMLYLVIDVVLLGALTLYFVRSINTSMLGL